MNKKEKKAVCSYTRKKPYIAMLKNPLKFFWIRIWKRMTHKI